MANNHNRQNNKCGHTHRHDRANGAKAFFLPTISLAMLITGIALKHIGNGSSDSYEWLQAAWYVTAFLPVGLPVIREAAASIGTGDIFNEFTLMTTACLGAFCIGEYPEAVGVMLFYNIGETLQQGAVDKATRNISHLVDMRDEQASVVRDGKSISTDPRTVAVGETIEVQPGGRVPLDGILLDRDSAFDTSALTGESTARTIRRDGEVLAGMISTSDRIRLRVTRPFEKSALSRILEMVRDASSRKAPAERFMRRFARIYTPIVAALAASLIAIPALISAISPAFNFELHEWLYRSLVFLVISCPCALVISIPLGYYAGIGAASRSGILVKGGNYLDALTKIDAVAFDKTGTLTTGQFHVEKICSVGMPEEELLAIAAAVESNSTHPIAKAITDKAREKQVTRLTADKMRERPGRGTEAIVDGHHVMTGNRRMLSDSGIIVPEESVDELSTTVICAIDGRYAGYIKLSDTIKEDSPIAVARLHDLRITDIAILSGDREEITEEIARRIGITDAHGGLMPADKAAWIERHDASGRHATAFVGDGFNDAPVLAASKVGIAMGGLGSDAAIESADVVIRTDQPSKVATAITIGHFTRNIVMQNIAGALAVKAIVLVLGATGHASLWAAVFADVGVALLAVANSMRVLYHKYY